MATTVEREAVRLRLQGWSLEKIGQLFGMSRERVRQIIKRWYRNFCKVWDKQDSIAEAKEKAKSEGLEFMEDDCITLKDLSVRAQRLLIKHGVKDFEDLAKFSDRQLAGIKGLGRKNIKEIIALMKLRGICCRGTRFRS